jgi:hypothetical protein
LEYHPRLDIQNLKLDHSRIILGSFPIWSLTKHSDDKGELIDVDIDSAEGEFPYFYGSSSNLLWKWYRDYIDSGIELQNVDSIERSLIKNKIGITDMILSCKRKGKSALDKDLSQRVYNHHFFNYPKTGETLKILCTSKGVMNDMFLNKSFFLQHERVTHNSGASLAFQRAFFREINGTYDLLKKPIFTELNIKDGGIIQCLSTPSPGSPYRRLVDFGYNGNVDLNQYLNNYLTEVFEWLN